MLYTAHCESPVGDILIADCDSGISGLWIDGQKYFFDPRNPAQERETPEIIRAKVWLDRYFAGEKPKITELNLAPSGNDFRQRVWNMLCEIPYGETVTYGEIARQIAANGGKGKMSAQAVGNAVGHNPISIIIPCHRVVGKGGNLTGYAGGIATKIKLLKHEGVDLSGFFIPKNGTAL